MIYVLLCYDEEYSYPIFQGVFDSEDQIPEGYKHTPRVTHEDILQDSAHRDGYVIVHMPINTIYGLLEPQHLIEGH